MGVRNINKHSIYVTYRIQVDLKTRTKMKFCYIVVLTFLIGLSRGEIVEEENVLVLNKDNFEEAVKQYPFLLVEYYAPWCGHCKALEPKYAAAATQLKEEGSDIKLAKVDATVEKELGEKAGVRGFPTLKFYKNGNAVDYSGGRDTDKIIAWLKKKTGPAAKELNTNDELEAFYNSGDVVVVGFFKDADSAEAKEFLMTADKNEDAIYGISYDEAIISDNNAPSIVLNSKDEGKFQYEKDSDGFSTDKIELFVKSNSVPIGAEFGESTYEKNFGSGVNHHLLLFISSKAEDHSETTLTFKKVAKEFKGKATYMWVDVEEDDNHGAMNFFDLEPPKDGETFTPTVRIVTFGEDTAKFIPEVESTDEQSLKDFTQGVLDGKIERHYKSEPLPEDWDALPVKVLVASNFHEVTGVDSGKNVFVEFYAPWCGHCKQLAPIWDQLGDKYNGNPDIVIAKMDATANELKGISVQGFPTIKYFKANGEVLDYSGKRDLEGFSKFLDSDGEVTVDEPEEESPPEDVEPEEEDEVQEPSDEPTSEEATEEPTEEPKKDEL